MQHNSTERVFHYPYIPLASQNHFLLSKNPTDLWSDVRTEIYICKIKMTVYVCWFTMSKTMTQNLIGPDFL